MKTGHVWYDCLIREINVQEKMRNMDCHSLRPQRQDLFWVNANKHEVSSQLLPKIRDQKHKSFAWELVSNSTNQAEFFFFISRDCKYIQHYSYLVLNVSGSLWQKFSEIRFEELHKLQTMVLKAKQPNVVKSWDVSDAQAVKSMQMALMDYRKKQVFGKPYEELYNRMVERMKSHKEHANDWCRCEICEESTPFDIQAKSAVEEFEGA